MIRASTSITASVFLISVSAACDHLAGGGAPAESQAEPASERFQRIADPTPRPTIDYHLLDADDFVFRIEQHEWPLPAGRVTTIHGDGVVVRVDHDVHRIEDSSGEGRTLVTWREERGHATAEEVRALRALLVQVDFPQLPVAYGDRLAVHGLSYRFILRSGSLRKEVQYAGWFPDPMASLLQQVDRLAEGPEDIEPITAEQARERARSLDRQAQP